ncbi:tlr0890 [Thermosynechococcus vestitus BP-1]|uniref:Tlr0890 protein n=1 Tax=Thermosynechococcus vestitus (strain NIES-2133 / IAM M-273 / BP-1) TaxID=197221 RepID=Q8DKG9_THEVB|nr:ATP-binding cassette domain-containing protein [Thermosynechococcus vestitus]BAC08442.1 tlr0890 [Thermosynechococcus vestitus BP-1]
MPAKTKGESLVRLLNVGKAYRQPNGQVISIMENINLELRTGEIVALLGPSGSGKSTLMRIITGLVAPTSGQVLYREQPMQGLNPGAAIVFQSSALYPWLTVLENVELGLKALGEGPHEGAHEGQHFVTALGR